jgi:hypothetical protein
MSIPVLYDACVLYGNEVRDLLIRIAISGNGESALDR